MLRHLPLFALLLALGAAIYLYERSAAKAAVERDLMERKLAILGEENERLRGLVAGAQKERIRAQTIVQRTEIERQVEAIRGLKFKQPVVYAEVSRARIKEVVAQMISRAYTEKEFIEIAASLAQLGVLPAGYPLRQKYVDLLGEQIAAFYDQHQHKLFMFEDASLDNQQNRVILAHELTHALQDQHFGLLRLPLEIKHNDDQALAASALVEGDATMVMSAYMLRNLSLRALKDNVTASLGQDAAQIQQAPRYLRELLVFPYLRGQEFCAAMVDGDDYSGLDHCYAQLPSSSSQILHPERYLAQADEAAERIAWPEPDLDGEKPETDNVLGEIGVRIQLAEQIDPREAERISSEWRNDRYLSFLGHDALVWKTFWASQAAAQDFLRAEQNALEKRYGLAHAEPVAATYRSDGRRAIRLVRSEREPSVLLIDAAAAPSAEKLLAQFSH